MCDITEFGLILSFCFSTERADRKSSIIYICYARFYNNISLDQ